MLNITLITTVNIKHNNANVAIVGQAHAAQKRANSIAYLKSASTLLVGLVLASKKMLPVATA